MNKKEPSPVYYPIFLNINNKRCVVIGGGQVALRKVKTLLEYGARIDVISPALCPELIVLAGNRQARVSSRHYQPRDLAKAFLVIAATDNRETNYQIAQEARRQAVLVNVVDDAENSDFILSATVRRGDITIAISTAGRSPALARKIRTQLEQDFGEEYAVLAQLIGEVRRELKQQSVRIDKETWQDALELNLLTSLVKQGQTEKVRDLLVKHLLKQHNEVR